jgi:uncharacterized protein YndB with AHSA1/START domain
MLAWLSYICVMSNATDTLTVTTEVNAPIETVWKLWNTPEDIMQWNNTSDAWHTPKATNDLRPGGKLLFVMGLKDGSFTFNFEGTYNEVKTNELLVYTLDDGRKTTITFSKNIPVKITETFEPNDTDPIDMQHNFCQAVLTSFKNYAEALVNQ